MQPRSPSAARCLAWQITCSNGLEVIIATVGEHVLLLSEESDAKASPWRMGKYLTEAEAHRRAVEMTGSYERMRKGMVHDPHEIALPEDLWRESVETNDLSEVLGRVIRSSVM